jgi:hypothetical protein
LKRERESLHKVEPKELAQIPARETLNSVDEHVGIIEKHI